MDTVIDHDQEKQSDTMDFSLVLGGPLYQIFRRAHLSGDMLDLLNRRMIVISAITWLPPPAARAKGCRTKW